MLKPWLTDRWCIPPAQDAVFVPAMEDVLAVYQRSVDPARPLVCFDEGGKELQADTRSAQPIEPGQVAREDFDYTRHGRAKCFLWYAPLLGQRRVTVTTQRTAVDWAHAMEQLVDVDFPDAERIVLVHDKLNTPTPASLSKAVPPAKAKRLWDQLEVHDTPKHGSWRNMAEIELSVLARPCLARRIPDEATLRTAVAAWVAARNAAPVPVHWQFTTVETRGKLAHLYPRLAPGNE